MLCLLSLEECKIWVTPHTYMHTCTHTCKRTCTHMHTHTLCRAMAEQAIDAAEKTGRLPTTKPCQVCVCVTGLGPNP